MKALTADIVARLSLFRADEGGRRTATPAHNFKCRLQIDGEYFDVRLDLEKTGPLSPGQTALVPINFLDREHAKKYCSKGKKFDLKEIATIGKGVIEKVLFSRSEIDAH